MHRTPNILLVLLDDLGFAQLGCFGGDFDTPHIDAVAARGLSYNRFHVTAICSSSRAALLTGRNHHAVGVGDAIRDALPGGPSGYTGVIPRSAATLARILRDGGFNTAAFGKWHIMPPREETPAGPFDRWPLGMGFENYYGFLRAEANQWTPHLVRDNHYLDPDVRDRPGYHVTEDLADQAIAYLRDRHNARPDQPFFVYFAPGAMHAPHHVAPEWADAYAGRYDDGWEALRARTFERQLARGIVPAGTILPERPSWIDPWDDLTADHARMHARMHEVYAGFLTHTDAQIGRLISFIDELGQLDDTIVIITSDNGASAEGGPTGTFNEYRWNMFMPDSMERNAEYIDEWGGIRGIHHYSWAWAWAGNTPLKLWKRFTWLGGTRTPLVVQWPKRITVGGEVRDQIIHINDVMPTLLDLCGIDPPEVVDGEPQQRIDGASFADSLDDAAAPSPRDVQYFEMRGSRSIISGSWKATTDHLQRHGIDIEDRLVDGSTDFAEDHWALYDLANDFSEAVDLSASHPEKTQELIELWEREAEANDVFPLMDGISVPWFFWERDAVDDSRRYAELLPGGAPVRYLALPKIRGGARISAEIAPIDGSESGILFSLGDWNSGFALLVSKRHLVFVLNLGGDVTTVRSDRPLAEGATRCAVRLGPVAGGGTDVTLDVDGEPVGVGRCPHDLPRDGSQWQVGGTALAIGTGHGFPVSEAYKHPFPWTGGLRRVVVDGRPAPGEPPAEEAAYIVHGD